MGAFGLAIGDLDAARRQHLRELLVVVEEEILPSARNPDEAERGLNALTKK